ncbi:helix-turn-helix domain-containing protein [Bowmanella dokdonensis]|uniref:Helix-turn-helix domain-containing protein n=1 Tax=Bowmanella dokdonensis TaxID=751969 RepID=A0A939DJK6_9ALTE|nr:helix-turn-helix domain-containing protein [Bowmanella dokdonensis]MBN7823924.1 helix-turn-helix domain-containing protein [Bowmanella dokdonensis]
MDTLTTGSDNPQLQLARALVEQTGLHLFLTGKAGTGKTTFLRDLKQSSPKRMMVTAPTGVAAINAGGVTLHSFFQLPFGPYVPGSELPHQHRFSKEKVNIILSLNLLVIDEISMVRADMLDAVDAVLRRHRRSDTPFGGVQLLMIGDLHQLAPVAKEQDWATLSSHYASPYFFSSQALQRAPWQTLELQQVYRQSDPRFIHLLNKIRDNQLDDDALALLASRYRPDFSPPQGEHYITLTTHNHSADAINSRQLAALDSAEVQFAAKVEGDYPAQNYPVAEHLLLKPGAQVMFMRNDNQEQRYYNGKTGVVTHLDKEQVRVRCPGEQDEILVTPVTWENIKYALDKDSGEITEQVIGSFTQMPLRLAWAVTIHKSQGLTFERAIIDGQAAFSHGQIYVALSRCKSLEGLVLQSPITASAVKTDEAVSQFASHQQPPDESLLQLARITYQQELLLQAFDFGALGYRLTGLNRALQEHKALIQSAGADQLTPINQTLQQAVLAVAVKFAHQLQSLFNPQSEPQQDKKVQERVTKAREYFTEQLAELTAWLQDFSFQSDNKAISKQLDKALVNLREAVAVKQAALNSMGSGFHTSAYLDAVAKAQIDKAATSTARKTTSELQMADLKHPKLLERLKAWRAEQAKSEDLPHYRILHQQVMLQIANALPGDRQTLLSLRKVGPATVDKYGEALLQLVADYCNEQGLQPGKPTPEPDKPKADKPKPDTKAQSLELFRQGLSPDKIAEQRGLATSTIETHLAHYVEQGELSAKQIVAPEKITAILEAADRLGQESFGVLKQALGDDYSYGEIKLALAGRTKREG